MSNARRPRPLLPLLLLLLNWDSGLAAAQDHTYRSADIEVGLRVYGAQCAGCHGANGDMVSGVDLRRGRFRRAVTDDDLAQVITKGTPGGMPPIAVTEGETTGLIALVRAGFDPTGTAVKVGNIERGRAVFTGKGACTGCHRVGSEGPRTAPELTDIGAVRTPAALQRSILDPTSAMLPINRPVRILTTAGRTIRGRRLNEDTFSVQLVDEAGRLVTVVKRDIKELEAAKASPMPPFAKTMSGDEVADLVAYLLSLRGVQ